MAGRNQQRNHRPQNRGTENRGTDNRGTSDAAMPAVAEAPTERRPSPSKAPKRSILIRPSAIMTPEISAVVKELEPFFEAAGATAVLTSAVRTPQEQLGIIKKKAVKFELDKKYPSITSATVDDIESWRGAWDELLNVKRFIVNPPKPARCKLGKRAGKTIGISPHMAKRAFDLAPGSPVETIASVVERCKKEGGQISQVLLETVNNAVHVTIQKKRDFKDAAIPEDVLDPTNVEFLLESENH